MQKFQCVTAVYRKLGQYGHVRQTGFFPLNCQRVGKCDTFLSKTPKSGNLISIFMKLLLYLFSLPALTISMCVSHQPASCCSLLLMDWLMVSICYCLIESLCRLVITRSACNQSRLVISSAPPIFLFFPQTHSADSDFVCCCSSFPLLNLFLFLSWDNL